MPDERVRWLSRLNTTARKLTTDELKLAVRPIEALFEHRAASPSLNAEDS